MLAAHPRGNSAEQRFVCFYHGWCFDTEGKFTAAPQKGAYSENLRKGCCNDTPSIRHAVFAGNVFVSLDPDVAPLAEFLGAAEPTSGAKRAAMKDWAASAGC